MPYNSSTGIYTATTGAETATAGQTIASAVWNAINVDYRTALTTLGQGVIPVLSSTAPAKVSDYYTAQAVVNFGASASDIASFAITLPASISTYRPTSLRIGNATGTLSGVTVTLYTGANATGTTVIGSTATTVTTGAANTPNNFQIIVPQSLSIVAFTAATLFLHISTSNAAANTATTVLQYEPLF